MRLADIQLAHPYHPVGPSRWWASSSEPRQPDPGPGDHGWSSIAHIVRGSVLAEHSSLKLRGALGSAMAHALPLHLQMSGAGHRVAAAGGLYDHPGVRAIVPGAGVQAAHPTWAG